ncbi:MAG: hypothetical protein CMJ75_20910 [Planctomycetaceae bacterium]|nr:hypothetical protein [Planctomycetaceae bacterium]
MRRNVVSLALCMCLAFPWAVAFSQGRRGAISQDLARRSGLELAWTTQLDLDPTRGRVVHIEPHISSTRAITVYEVYHLRGKDVIRNTDLDRNGRPLGADGALVAAVKRMRAIIRSDPNSQADPEVAQTAELVEKLIADAEALAQQTEQAEESDEAKEVEEKVDLATSLLQRAQAKPEVMPRLQRRMVPDIRLYAASATGIVQALDAETGATLWSTKIGRPTLVTQGPAANDDVVAVTNGSTVYVLDSADGQLLWKKLVSSYASGRRITEVPSASPAISDTQVLVPTVRGDLLGYDLREPLLFPTRYGALGRALTQPIVVTQSVAWPTTARAARRGSTTKSYLYVANANEAGTRYRLESPELILGRPAYRTKGGQTQFFVASRDGYLTCLSERSGRLQWRFSAGEPLEHQPVVFGDGVYIMSADGGMWRINADSGQEEWWTPGIFGFVSASRNRLYCTSETGRIVIVDTNTGSRRGILQTEVLNVKLINTQTDRLFMGTRNGLLQCFHEPEQDWPLIHFDAEEETKDSKEKTPKEKSPSDRDAAPMPTDTNPFGGDDGKPAAGDDPFGADAAAKPAGDDDPFADDKPMPADKKAPADDDPFK